MVRNKSFTTGHDFGVTHVCPGHLHHRHSPRDPIVTSSQFGCIGIADEAGTVTEHGAKREEAEPGFHDARITISAKSLMRVRRSESDRPRRAVRPVMADRCFGISP